MGISITEYRRRYLGIRNLMQAEGFDCLLVVGRGDDFNRGNIRYITGSGNGGVCIFPLEGAPIFLVRPHQSRSPKLASLCDALELLDLRETRQPEKQALEELSRCSRGGRIGIVGMPSITVPMYLALTGRFAGRTADAAFILDRMRIIKSSEEITQYRHAAAIADDVYRLLRRIVRPGITEYEVYGAAKKLIYERGCGYSFELIDGAGATMNMSFYPTADKLESPGTLFFEITPAFHGYYAQLPVTLPVGSYPPHVHEMVKAWASSDEAARQVMRPGVKVSDVHRAQIAAVEACGFISPLESGHDLGLDAHETIYMDAESEVIIQPGMVLAVHACVMQSAVGDGVGMGYTYLITETGAERFSKIDLASELI